MKKRITALILAVGIILTVAGCGQQNKDAGQENKTIHCAIFEDMTTMDVAKTTNDYYIPLNVFDRLFETVLDENGTAIIKNSLCDSWSVSEDGCVYSFVLKDGVIFSNGNPLTADDVKYTFERLLSVGMVNDDIPWEVVGAENFVSGSSDTLEGFRVKDDLHFDIELAEVNSGFIAELSACAVSIVDKETTEGSDDFGMTCEATVGSGPYKITEWVKNDHFTLERNDRYWGEKPQAEKFIMHIIPDSNVMEMSFEKGELDILSLDNLDPKKANDVYKKKYPDRLFGVKQAMISYFALNENNRYLSDVNVRKAITMAIDVDSIINDVFCGEAIPQHGIIPTGVLGHNEELVTRVYDPEGAKKLLEEAGYEPGEITFRIDYYPDEMSDNLVMQIIARNLKDIGINAEMRSYDQNTWLEMRSRGELDSYTGAWYMDYNEPGNVMYPFFGSAELSTARSLNYKNKEVMGRVAGALNINDSEKRLSEYNELEKIIIGEDAAWVPLFETTLNYCVSEKISSMKPYWSGYNNIFFVKDIRLK